MAKPLLSLFTMSRLVCCLALTTGIGCQDIVEDPLVDGGDEYTPEILLNYVSPQSQLITIPPGGCGTLNFKVGEVRDFDLSATLQELWGVDCANNPCYCYSSPQNLAQDPTAPSIWTDTGNPVQTTGFTSGNHLVQVWVSDEPILVSCSPDGGGGGPNSAHDAVETDWVISVAAGTCP